MLAAIQDVKKRHREFHCSVAAKFVPELAAVQCRARMSDGERNAEDGIRAESALRGCAIKCDERRIKDALIADRRAVECLRDLAVHRSDGAKDPLAAEAALIAVAKLHRFVCAGRGARWNSGATSCAATQGDVHLDGRIAARVKNLTRVDRGDAVAHASGSLSSSSSSADGLMVGFGFAAARFGAAFAPGFTGAT